MNRAARMISRTPDVAFHLPTRLVPFLEIFDLETGLPERVDWTRTTRTDGRARIETLRVKATLPGGK